MIAKPNAYRLVSIGSLTKHKEYDGFNIVDSYTSKSMGAKDEKSSSSTAEKFSLRQLWQACLCNHPEIDIDSNGQVCICVYDGPYMVDFQKAIKKREGIRCTLPAGSATRAFLRGARKLGIM